MTYVPNIWIIIFVTFVMQLQRGESFFPIKCEKACKCSTNLQYREISCRYVHLKVHLILPLVIITCLVPENQTESSVFSEFNDFEIINKLVLEVRIFSCPLPPTSYQNIFSSININKVKDLNIYSSPFKYELNQKHFENLSSVKSLALFNNGITSLPHDIFQDMNKLFSVYIRENNFNLTNKIFQFTPNLSLLYITHNNATELSTDFFENLTKLKFLNLQGSKPLQNIWRTNMTLPQLEMLFLRSTGLRMLNNNTFHGMKKLSIIDISHNEIESIPPDLLKESKTLVSFCMVSNNGGTLSLPDGFFSNQVHLENITISASKLKTVSKHAFSSCESAKHVDLSSNFIEHISKNTFTDLRSLNNLDLSGNQIIHLPEDLFLNNRDLKYLNLSYNKIQNIPQSLFAHLSELRTLDLGNNKIKNIAGNQFWHLIKLETLDISKNQLVSLVQGPELCDYDQSVLYNCRNLQQLKLSNNSLTDLYDDWRMDLVNLQTLDLSFNNFTTFKTMESIITKKVKLNLSGNLITEVFYQERNQSDLSPAIFGSVDLSYNPLIVDCDLVRLFRKTSLVIEYPLTISSNEIKLDSDKITELDMFTTNQHPCSSSHLELKNSSCPEGCRCNFRPFSLGLVVNCQRGGLVHTPAWLPRHVRANHTELYLFNNRLKDFALHGHHGYGNVTHLNLAKNSISSLDIRGVSKRLKLLDVSRNNLTALSEETLDVLEAASDLERLELHDNPWSCDCAAQRFIRFVQANQRLHIRHQILCADGVPMKSIQAPCLRFFAYVVGGVMIALLASALLLTLLYYRYRLHIHVYCYSSRWPVLRWIVTSTYRDEDSDHVYDAFISFSHADESFVADQLVPFLQDTEDRKFKLCLHYRDWVAGEMIPNQIVNSVRSSRRTIVVLSPNFLESVWGVMEFRTAHSLAISEGRTKVIVILYQDVGSVGDLDEEIRAYLQMNTYVKWGSPWFWKQLAYAMPHPMESRKFDEGEEGIPLNSLRD